MLKSNIYHYQLFDCKGKLLHKNKYAVRGNLDNEKEVIFFIEQWLDLEGFIPYSCNNYKIKIIKIEKGVIA